jgi:dihydrofolate reductase
LGKLIYAAIASLDGYIADEEGNFGWAEPDEEVHVFVNDLERQVDTYLYGRRLYQVMAYWETLPLDDQQPHIRDFASVWKAADKIVYSKTLEAPSTPNTRIERQFDPAAVRRLKVEAVGDIAIGGAALAAHAFSAHLVDELHLFVAPVVIGGGTRALAEGLRIPLELLDERRFGSGFVYLRYRSV